MLMEYLNTPEKLQRRLVHTPMGRFGEAMEQAKVVVFREHTRRTLLQQLISSVASDDSSFVNGTDFLVDGGLSACYVVCGQIRFILTSLTKG